MKFLWWSQVAYSQQGYHFAASHCNILWALTFLNLVWAWTLNPSFQQKWSFHLWGTGATLERLIWSLDLWKICEQTEIFKTPDIFKRRPYTCDQWKVYCFTGLEAAEAWLAFLGHHYQVIGCSSCLWRRKCAWGQIVNSIVTKPKTLLGTHSWLLVLQQVQAYRLLWELNKFR